MICPQCKSQTNEANLTCSQCGSDLASVSTQASAANIKKTAGSGNKYVGQIASWLVICVFVFLYKLILPKMIDSPLWENSTVFGIGVALSWLVGRLIGKVLANKKAI